MKSSEERWFEHEQELKVEAEKVVEYTPLLLMGATAC